MSEANSGQPSGESAQETTRRRLAPQVSFKSDPSYENGKGRGGGDVPKKAVIRFTREVLIAKRKQSKILASMAALPDITTEVAQDPVCFDPLDPEDVVRIWNAAKANQDRSQGRGRTKTNKDEDTDNKETTKGGGGGLWDSEDTSAFDDKPFDFSKVAEESERFRSELDRMKGTSATQVDASKAAPVEDAMETLLQEQEYAFSSKDSSAKTVQSTPSVAEPVKMTKIEFGSLLMGNSEPSPSFDAHSSSLMSKIGVKLEPENPKPAAPSLPASPPEWFYRDPNQQIQGPFSQQNMFQWNKEGYFMPDLPIQLRGWTKFYAFVDIFPINDYAFTSVPTEPIVKVAPPTPSVVAKDTFSLSSLERTAPINQPAAPAPKPAQTVAPKPTAAEERSLSSGTSEDSKKASFTADVDRSNIAKKLLGIGSFQQNQPSGPNSTPAAVSVTGPGKTAPVVALDSKTVDREQPVKDAKKVTRQEKTVERRESAQAKQQSAPVPPPAPVAAEVRPKGWNKDAADTRKSASGASNLLEIQKEQQVEPKPRREVEPLVEASAPSPSGASLQLKSFLGIQPKVVTSGGSKGWSTQQQAASTHDNQGKSLQDIMNEELIQKESSSVDARVQANSWASKAKSGGPVTPFVASAPVISRAAPGPAPTLQAPSSVVIMPRPTPVESKTVSPTPPAFSQSKPSSKTDFGGKAMSPDMSEWCVAQLRRINGTDDLTLLDFCMSLKSAAEVRETLVANLGSSAQTTNFATEFIRYKDEGKKPVGLADGAGVAADVKKGNAFNPTAFQGSKKKKTAK